MPRQNKSIFIWLKIRGRHRDLQLLKLQSVLIRSFFQIFKDFNHQHKVITSNIKPGFLHFIVQFRNHL